MTDCENVVIMANRVMPRKQQRKNVCIYQQKRTWIIHRLVREVDNTAAVQQGHNKNIKEFIIGLWVEYHA